MSWLFIYGVLQWCLRVGMVPVILRRRFEPMTALAYLSLVFFLPELGLIVYLLLGQRYLGRRRLRAHRAIVLASRSADRLAQLQSYVIGPHIDPQQLPVVLQAEGAGGMEILGGNNVELLADARQFIDRMIADIDSARNHVHMLFYIYSADDTGKRVSEALARAAKRGVKCRLLADAAGSFGFFRSGMAEQLQQQGVEVYPALPVISLRRRLARLDLRNHRKLAVIDGQVAYTGSHNVVNPDAGPRRCGPWLDMSGRYTGPVVAQLQSVFLDDWVFETERDLAGPDTLPPMRVAGEMIAQAIPTGPNHESETFPRVLVAAIHAARRKVIMTTPYFVPDEATMLALCMAADRQVEVTLVIPQRADHLLVSLAGRAYYQTLLESGVNVYEHCVGLLHAKTLTVDDSFALLGSSNIDVRSFHLNFELGVIMYGPQITRELRFAQTRYISESRALELASWSARPWPRQLAENAAALFSPLL